MWEEISHVCRLDEAEPVAAWQERLGLLSSVASKLTDLRLRPFLEAVGKIFVALGRSAAPTA